MSLFHLVFGVQVGLRTHWVAVKELHLIFYIAETLVFTLYIYIYMYTYVYIPITVTANPKPLALIPSSIQWLSDARKGSGLGV